MRHNEILVLVDFVWIFGAVSSFSREWKLCDTIIKLLNWRRDLFSDINLRLLDLWRCRCLANLKTARIHDNFWQVALPLRLLLLLGRRQPTIVKLSALRHFDLLFGLTWWSLLLCSLFLLVTAADLLTKIASIRGGFDLRFAYGWPIQLDDILALLLLHFQFITCAKRRFWSCLILRNGLVLRVECLLLIVGGSWLRGYLLLWKIDRIVKKLLDGCSMRVVATVLLLFEAGFGIGSFSLRLKRVWICLVPGFLTGQIKRLSDLWLLCTYLQRIELEFGGLIYFWAGLYWSLFPLFLRLRGFCLQKYRLASRINRLRKADFIRLVQHYSVVVCLAGSNQSLWDLGLLWYLLRSFATRLHASQPCRLVLTLLLLGSLVGLWRLVCGGLRDAAILRLHCLTERLVQNCGGLLPTDQILWAVIRGLGNICNLVISEGGFGTAGLLRRMLGWCH
jgi:hypothetical protein